MMVRVQLIILEELTVYSSLRQQETRRNIDTYPTYPASFDSENLLVVASSTSNGSLSWFSNYGLESVDIVGPGSAFSQRHQARDTQHVRNIHGFTKCCRCRCGSA